MMSNYEQFRTIMKDAGFALSNKPVTKKILENAISFSKCDKKTVLAKQHEITKKIYFLLNGSAKFNKYFEKNSLTFATINKKNSPLGISGLNPPGRFMAEIMIDENSEYYSFDLNYLDEIESVDPGFVATFLSYILFFSTNLLWSTRNLDSAYKQNNYQISKGSNSGIRESNYEKIKDTIFFSSILEEDVKKLLNLGEIKLYSTDEFIALEGNDSSGLNILLSGKVEGSFNSNIDNSIKKKYRSIARPGVALSLSCGKRFIKFPYSIQVTRDTRVLHLSNDAINNLIKDNPVLAIKLLKRQIWQLGRYQQSATGLARYAAKNEIELLKFLIQDNFSKLPVNSKIYSVPHLLENRYSHELAFDIIYNLMVTGNEIEKSIANLMSDALKSFEKQQRFFKELNIIYNRVEQFKKVKSKASLDKLTLSNFIKAFDHVPYVIKGLENLPEKANHIFFYNHLAANDENKLANGHAFSIDSHFVSAKILYPKYGDGGKRIVRASRNTEYWRHNFYENLDYIFVHTKESDLLNESDDEKKERKNKFFNDAQDIINAGQPLVIAPEGTSETEDNFTDTSPGPFKPGAFTLAGQLKPEPYLVPIALANFDKPVSSTVYSAVIKQPIKISNFVKDTTNINEIKSFLLEYRKTFKGYVEEANELSNKVKLDTHDLTNLNTNYNLVSPIEEEFELDVRELELNSINQSVNQKEIILFGSSTFRMWENYEQDLGGKNILNLAFGGSTLSSCRTYFERIFSNYNPKILFFYGGDNDIGRGLNSDQINQEFLLFATQAAEKLKNTKCFFISIKPSPFRKKFLTEITNTNDKIKNTISTLEKWRFIDICNPMLKAGYDKFYDQDQLHMNDLGYSLLSKSLRDEIAKTK